MKSFDVAAVARAHHERVKALYKKALDEHRVIRYEDDDSVIFGEEHSGDVPGCSACEGKKKR